MKLRVGAVVIAAAILGAAAFVPAVSEGRGGNGRGRCGQTQSQCRQRNPNCTQDRQRLRDGSCGNPACPQQGTQQGNCPGPAGGQGAGAPGGGTGTGN